MSKFKQSFTRKKQVYKLDEKKDELILTDEVDDLQEKMNSQYSETLYYNLEKYFEGCNVEKLEGIDDDYAEAFNNADRFTDALDTLDDLRSRYNVPDDLFYDDAIDYVRSAIKVELQKGGNTNDETQTQSAEPQE